MTSIHVNRFGHAPDLACCRAGVQGDWHSSQCTRKVAITREVNGKPYGFCKQHDPEAVAAFRAARQAKWEAEWAVKQAGWDRDKRRKEALPMLVEAIKAIAAGHNDARTLAAETLAKIGDV